MNYLQEFRSNWLSLLATFIGIATGSALSHYTMSLFAPELIAEFGWSKSQFALVGSLPLVTMLIVPFAGRFTDRFGVRVAASIGFAAISIGFFALSAMNGNIVQFFGIWLFQHIFGVLTTSLVFTRVIVERFDRARGSSLSLLMMGPPLSGAIAAPVLGSLIAAEGWRTGFIALAVVSGVGGLVCVLLMGRSSRMPRSSPARMAHAPLTRHDFLALLADRRFLLLVGGMFLINIPQVFASSQLKLIVLANGISNEAATWMVSLYALGVILGRFIFGIALDRIRAHLVAFFALSLPALGFCILAMPSATVPLLAGAVLAVGVAQGAEGDIGSYMISREFDLTNYGLILGFVKAGLDGGGAVGALILSFSLQDGGTYQAFLLLSAATTLIGAVCFYLVGHARSASSAGSK